MTQHKAERRNTSGQLGPKLPGLGRLPNKQFNAFSPERKYVKYATVATVALLANSGTRKIDIIEKISLILYNGSNTIDIDI